jgi:hypothetical protein
MTTALHLPLHLIRAAAAAILALAVSLPAFAQPAATYKNGAEFYLAYRAAFAKATSIDDLLPWMAKVRRDQIAKAPAQEKREGFEMIKAFDNYRDVKVLKETPNAKGAELQVQAIGGDAGKKATGDISLVKEGGAWKIDKESWKGSM